MGMIDEFDRLAMKIDWMETKEKPGKYQI